MSTAGPQPRSWIKRRDMIRTLPVFNGYTVDMRLQEFRKIELDKLPEFIPFLSDKGAKLFYEFRQTEEGRKELNRFLGRSEDY